MKNSNKKGVKILQRPTKEVIESLKNKGYKNREICELLGISNSTLLFICSDKRREYLKNYYKKKREGVK